MKTLLILTAALIAPALSAHAESLYRCERFNGANTYEVAINTTTGVASFTGNKAPAVLSLAATSSATLEFRDPANSALLVDFDPARLEAIVSTIDIYGNREEIGEGVCHAI